ncbi:MAG TPA: hypothetical protein VGO00_00715, partial [Kofleriaceae bacterium]|nr:hypothetical protein [Kofleriaceae bacterium]
MSDFELGGGSLRHILETYVVEDGQWRKHAARLAKGSGAKTRKALERALGGDVPAEIAEWLDAEGKGVPEQRDSGWMIGLELDVPDGVQQAIPKHAVLLLAGLVPFGHDACGDRAFVSVLPHPLDVAEVYRYDHEVGKLDDKLGESIADFLVATWVDDEHADHKAIAKARKAFEARADKALAGGPLRSDALFERSKWLLGLLDGEPAFEFPALLAKAPSLNTWKQEKARLANPHLAVYWMLAHLFLGNDDACQQAATAAAASKGAWVAELARSVRSFFAGKAKSPIKSLSAAELAAMREVVAKNASPEQTGRVVVDDSEVRAHDDALRTLAKSDRDKAGLIAEYFRERGDDSPANLFPYKAVLPDWLVAPAAAAYRAGLRVDLGHPKAYAGITTALASRADHPDARAVLVTALDMLAPNDRRLEPIVPALVERREPEAVVAVRKAAYRWVELAPEIDAVLARREKTFTLDDVFARDDLLHPAVCAVLEPCDDESERLALVIADKALSFRVRKTIAGLQCRVYGARGITARLDPMLSFLGLFAEAEPDEDNAVRLDATAAVALSEASLAVARLDPTRARPLFDKLLAAKRFSDARVAGITACVLPGLLHLDRDDANGRLWLERVLGARNGYDHIYGALIAARVATITEAIPWIVPHAYTSRLNELMGQYAFLETTARKTLESLGQPAPPFDEGDEYARDVPVARLGDALVRHDRYDNGAVLERMAESKDPARFVAPLAAFLEERFRFSKWEAESHVTSEDEHSAIKLLRAGGKQELDRLA